MFPFNGIYPPVYIASFNRLQEKKQVDGVPDAQIEQQLHRIHHFAVCVDIIGECVSFFFGKITSNPVRYRLSQTLSGNPRIMGLFGFFPTYNVHNYTEKVRKSGQNTLRGWHESDALVFRQAQAMSDRIESCPTTDGITC